MFIHVYSIDIVLACYVDCEDLRVESFWKKYLRWWGTGEMKTVEIS